MGVKAHWNQAMTGPLDGSSRSIPAALYSSIADVGGISQASPKMMATRTTTPVKMSVFLTCLSFSFSCLPTSQNVGPTRAFQGGVAGKRWRGPTPPTKKRCTRMHMRLGPNTNRGAHTPPQPTSPKPHHRQQRPRPGMFSRRAKKCPRFRGRDWHDVSHATSFDGCRDARGCFGI